ncbi:hypothetical protein J0H58_34525 [bacterium]|nr:hypothetical protein [bacterium]
MPDLQSDIASLEGWFADAFGEYGDGDGLSLYLFAYDGVVPAPPSCVEDLYIPPDYFRGMTWVWDEVAAGTVTDPLGQEHSYLLRTAGAGGRSRAAHETFLRLAGQAGALYHRLDAGAAPPSVGNTPWLVWARAVYTYLKGQGFVVEGPGFSRVRSLFAASTRTLALMTRGRADGRFPACPGSLRPGLPGVPTEARFRIVPCDAIPPPTPELEAKLVLETDEPAPDVGRLVAIRDKAPPGEPEAAWEAGWSWAGPPAGTDWRRCLKFGRNPFLGVGRPPAVCTWLPPNWHGELFPLGRKPEHVAGWAGTVRWLLDRPEVETAPPGHPVYGWATLLECTRLLARHHGVIDGGRLNDPLPTDLSAARMEARTLLLGIEAGGAAAPVNGAASDVPPEVEGETGTERGGAGAEGDADVPPECADLLAAAESLAIKGKGLKTIRLIVEKRGRAHLADIAAVRGWVEGVELLQGRWNSARTDLNVRLARKGLWIGTHDSVTYIERIGPVEPARPAELPRSGQTKKGRKK